MFIKLLLIWQRESEMFLNLVCKNVGESAYLPKQFFIYMRFGVKSKIVIAAMLNDTQFLRNLSPNWNQNKLFILVATLYV